MMTVRLSRLILNHMRSTKKEHLQTAELVNPSFPYNGHQSSGLPAEGLEPDPVVTT
jgi:hypothetical protein